MKMNGNEIRPGNIIEHKGSLWEAVRTQHTQPGKGGAYMQVELKDIRNGTKLNERFRAAETVERVRLDQRDYQYLYSDGDMLNLMDPESYEQITMPAAMLGEQAVYLQDGMTIVIMAYEGESISAKLPSQVTLEVAETEPVVKGQTAASSNKPATLSNGVRVMVPPFIGVGDMVVVSTEDNSYVERAKAS